MERRPRPSLCPTSQIQGLARETDPNLRSPPVSAGQVFALVGAYPDVGDRLEEFSRRDLALSRFPLNILARRLLKKAGITAAGGPYRRDQWLPLCAASISLWQKRNVIASADTMEASTDGWDRA